MVAPLLRPWSATGFRHIPAGATLSVLDTRFAGRSGDNRWNDAGTPTFYIAGDRAVAIAEFARHLREESLHAVLPPVIERTPHRLELHLNAVLDLRDPLTRAALAQTDDLRQFLALGYARATANFIRRTTEAQALLVPSMAFLDDASRWNLVLFLEKLPGDINTFITATYDSNFRAWRR